MKKVSYVLAALATIAVAAPTVASAEGFGFRFEATAIITGTSIVAPEPSSTDMIGDSIAAGTTTVATGR